MYLRNIPFLFFTSVLGCGEESASNQRDGEIHKQIYFLFVGFIEQFKRSHDMVIQFIHLNWILILPHNFYYNSNIVLWILSSHGIGTRQLSPVRRVLFWRLHCQRCSIDWGNRGNKNRDSCLGRHTILKNNG